MSQPQAGPSALVAPHAVAGVPSVRSLLLLSAACLVVQVAVTDYGAGSGTGGFWLVVGALLLWLVGRRHSRVARGVIVVSAFVGVVLHGLAVVHDPRAAVVALAFLGQALPLLAGPVRRHVQERPGSSSR